MHFRELPCGYQISYLASTSPNMTSDNNTIDTSTVRQAVDHICTGKLKAYELVQHHLSVINDTDKKIGAWASLDENYALSQAQELDSIRMSGRPVGALHGIPVGIKDIFDTCDLPTERGSSLCQGRAPTQDSAVVEKLKEAGAVIMGKTVTTEFAFMHPSDTRNPHNAEHSPGGSSSGSAASVAAGHVGLAIGSQTNGSVVRPASFCGVYGFKPSRGLISRYGALETSNTLDQVGFFARDVGDIALLADALTGYDRADSATNLLPKPAMLSSYLSEAPVPPTLAWFDMPYANQYASDASAGFEELLDVLGATVERIPTPQSFAALIPCHKIIHEYEIVRCLQSEIGNELSGISETIAPTLAAARNISDAQYQEALEIRAAADDWFVQFFNDYDAILTPSALGEAPKFSDGTGNPVCCTIWTLCGLPCINLPLLTGDNDLPIGVQLVGALNEDDRLLRTTRHLLTQLHSAAQEA